MGFAAKFTNQTESLLHLIIIILWFTVSYFLSNGFHMSLK